MTLLAHQERAQGAPDTIFAYAGQAATRAAQVGRDNIVNATIGSFLNADGSLATLPAVELAMAEVPFKAKASYAPIDGIPAAIDAMIDDIFRDCRPNAFIEGVATPGGAGALHNAFSNYLTRGDVCLTTNYYWDNYDALLRLNGCSLETFPMLGSGESFNTEGCLAACRERAKKQKNVMLLLNTPAHNPTGFSVPLADWKALVAGLKDLAKSHQDGGVVVVVDVAYIDYAGFGSREFFKCFENLPENMITIVCASMSKGYTIYGYRLGCEICIAPTKASAEEFKHASGTTARGTWSNCSRPAMEMVLQIASDPEKLARFRREQEEFAGSLARRANAFLSEAKQVGLKPCPYQSGFFIYVPTPTDDDARRLAAELQKADVFTVPLGKGVRVAICAISEEKIAGLATLIHKDIQVLGL